MTQIIKTSRRYNLISACFAFLLWGGWTFYINTQQGSLKHGIISGLTQGICSFVITLFMTFIIDKQFNYFKNLKIKLFLPPILTVLFTGSFLILVHHLIGTPSILYTLTPVLTVAFLFAIFTNFKLYQHYKQYQMP
ncbi:hypothetical protein [Acinetobacter sp. ANC 4648]|uniref:hypothetical protein n=1 Tax=Acinetobacter sp. ANC 4648 TaxID=1977875 RepID=UPI000A33AD25|nr:hypothetical protein [Acinetobacter sp. ANC 4648]OTG80734.1 hypothetical protein B9T27_12780 [Acinetobacter sp. ANC 4648]